MSGDHGQIDISTNCVMTQKRMKAGERPSRSTKAVQRTRLPLTRQKILDTALKLTDSKGFHALSMRQLGRALNIEAMSIYHYFKSKDELLDGLHSVMMQRILKIMRSHARQSPSWNETVRHFASAYRNVGRAHPHVFRIAAQRPLIMEEGIQTGHSLMNSLEEAGLSGKDAIVAYRAITCFVAGFVLLENAKADRFYTTGDFDLEFAKGLEIILVGIEECLTRKLFSDPARRPSRRF